jgi:hypothetical protein
MLRRGIAILWSEPQYWNLTAPECFFLLVSIAAPIAPPNTSATRWEGKRQTTWMCYHLSWRRRRTWASRRVDQWRRVVKPNRNLPCAVQKVAKLRPVALPAHASALLSAPDFCALSLSSLSVPFLSRWAWLQWGGDGLPRPGLRAIHNGASPDGWGKVWLGFLWGAQGGRPSPKPAPSVQSAPRNTKSVARLVTARKTDPTAWSHEPERRGCEEGQAIKRGPSVSEWRPGWCARLPRPRMSWAGCARGWEKWAEMWGCGPSRGFSSFSFIFPFIFCFLFYINSYFEFKSKLRFKSLICTNKDSTWCKFIHSLSLSRKK